MDVNFWGLVAALLVFMWLVMAKREGFAGATLTIVLWAVIGAVFLHLTHPEIYHMSNNIYIGVAVICLLLVALIVIGHAFPIRTGPKTDAQLRRDQKIEQLFWGIVLFGFYGGVLAVLIFMAFSTGAPDWNASVLAGAVVGVSLWAAIALQRFTDARIERQTDLAPK
jgi:hypothetical protein